jgi:hypothetical protein
MSKTRTLAQIAGARKVGKKGHYVGHLRSLVLKTFVEIRNLAIDCRCRFEHPSEVQHESIPQAVLGGDIICQAVGYGKTYVFVSRPCIS